MRSQRAASPISPRLQSGSRVRHLELSSWSCSNISDVHVAKVAILSVNYRGLPDLGRCRLCHSRSAYISSTDDDRHQNIITPNRDSFDPTLQFHSLLRASSRSSSCNPQ